MGLGYVNAIIIINHLVQYNNKAGRDVMRFENMVYNVNNSSVHKYIPMIMDVMRLYVVNFVDLNAVVGVRNYLGNCDYCCFAWYLMSASTVIELVENIDEHGQKMIITNLNIITGDEYLLRVDVVR